MAEWPRHHLSGWLDWDEVALVDSAGTAGDRAVHRHYPRLRCELTPSLLTGRATADPTAPPVAYVRLSAVDEAGTDPAELQLLLAVDGGRSVTLTAPDGRTFDVWRQGLQQMLAEHSTASASASATPSPWRRGPATAGSPERSLLSPLPHSDGPVERTAGSISGGSAPSVASTTGTSPPHRRSLSAASTVGEDGPPASRRIEVGSFLEAGLPPPPPRVASIHCPPVEAELPRPPSPLVTRRACLAPPVDHLTDKPLPREQEYVVPATPPRPFPFPDRGSVLYTPIAAAAVAGPSLSRRPPPPAALAWDEEPPPLRRDAALSRGDPLLCLCQPRPLLKHDAHPGRAAAAAATVYACLTLDGRHLVAVPAGVFARRLRKAGLPPPAGPGAAAPVAVRSLHSAREFFGQGQCIAMPVANVRFVRAEATPRWGGAAGLLCFRSRSHALVLETDTAEEAAWLAERWSQLLRRRP